MENYLQKIENLKEIFTPLQGEDFQPATDGTHYKVFLSGRYIVRFRDDNPELLLREVDLLKELDHPLIPKVLWAGEINGSTAMIEDRLPGKNINLVWKTLPDEGKSAIVKQVVELLRYLKTRTRDHIYSVTTGKKYTSYVDYLTESIEQKANSIKKFDQADNLLKDILVTIDRSKEAGLFSDKEITLVHGDLIIHNLLTDGENLTGVLDWELALFGDPNHDLFRLFYYQECAKAYQEQGIDEAFEADYMDRLISAISNSDLIKDKAIFQVEYHFVLSIFHLNALYWASNSDNPQENIDDLVLQWDKK